MAKRLTIRITDDNGYLDSIHENLDTTHVTAVVNGSPTKDEIMTSVNNALFNDTLFPASAK